MADAAPQPPAQMNVLCPFCSREEAAALLPVRQHDEGFRCPTCKRAFSILTRYILRSTSRQNARGAWYDVRTLEPDGRERVRRLRVARNTQIVPHTWVTLVWFEGRLAGVSDHTNRLWFPAEMRDIHIRFRPVYRILFVAVGVLAFLQLTVLVGRLAEVFRSDPGTAALSGGLVLALCLAPLLYWMVSTVVYEEEDDEIEDPFAEAERARARR